MAAAVKAKAYGLKRKRNKAAKPSYKALRAAKRQGVVPEFIPSEDKRTATAVAQLATPGVAAALPSMDDLSIIRARKVAATPAPQDSEEPEELPKPKASKAKAPEVKVKEPVVKEASKAAEEKPAKKKGPSDRLLKKRRQAEKRAEAEERKRVQREEANRVKKEQAKEREAKRKAELNKPKPAKASRRKRKQMTEQQRQLRIEELRAKRIQLYPDYQVPAMITENEAADLAVCCEFDLTHYLKCLLAGKFSKAQAYVNTVTSYSKPVAKALISLHVDKIRNALHADLQSAETWYSSEDLEPHYKQKYEDPRSKMSDAWAIHHEGGMHLYEFSQKVYVTITEDGEVVEEGMFNRLKEHYRTRAYVAWLEQNHCPDRHVELNSFDRRTGKVTNDFYLQQAYEPCPVMVGNLQVGTNFVRAERIIPLSWEVAKFKHELRNSGSQSSRKNRGKEPIAGLVGVKYLEGLMRSDEASPPAVAANDEVVPWEAPEKGEVKSEGKVAKSNPQILPRALRERTRRPNPEYVYHTHLDSPPVARAAKWVESSKERIAKVAAASWEEAQFVGPPQIGLRSSPEYRYDPGPPGVAESRTVIYAKNRFPSKTVNLTPSTKQPVVGAVTHDPPLNAEQPKQPLVLVATHNEHRPKKGSVLSILSRKEACIQERLDKHDAAYARLMTKCPPQPNGHRLERMCRATIKDLTETTRQGWRKRWAVEVREQGEVQRLHNWFEGKRNDESHSVNLWATTYDAKRYEAWTDSAMRKQQRHDVSTAKYQQHLANMEDRWPSLVRPEECKVCERTHDERYEAWNEAKRKAELKEACMVRDFMGMLVLDRQKYNAALRALPPKAKKGPAAKSAVIREPVVRASKPDQLNQGSTGGGQSSITLQQFMPSEIDAMQQKVEDRAVEILVWSSLKGLVPKDKIQGILNHFIQPGRLLIRPT